MTSRSRSAVNSSASPLVRERMRRHALTQSPLDDPVEIVRSMGATQAQDYGQSLWAIASRMRIPDLGAVVRAVEGRRIVRTWPMRGTVHWMPTEDAAWMVALSAERTLRGAARRRQDLELTEEILTSADELLTRALSEAGTCHVPR